jgi:IS1 family transposase
LWVWVAVSRLTRQVLGFVLGDHTDPMLGLAWSDVPPDYHDKPVYTDHWGAYARFFPAAQHQACDKGSGLTSIVEALNTKWRQRQSSMVRRSCGVHPKIEADMFERFLLLVDSHNRQGEWHWRRQQGLAATTLGNP